jgi:hypothetical protein
MAADQLQGGVEEAAAQGGRWYEPELVEQVLLAAEQPVQGGAGDPRGGGQLVHRQAGQAVLVLALARAGPVAAPGGGEGRQDLLLGDGRRWHEIRLDEMYRLV